MTIDTIKTENGASILTNVSNDADTEILTGAPYVATVRITGTAPLLYHRWSNEAVEAKSKAAKNSAAKKTDNLESYVYRTASGSLGIPGEYLRMSVIGAARYRQDPRSPRKSGMDLFKAGVIALTDIADTGCEHWQFEDRRRVLVQRSAITRVRPGLLAGWTVEIQLQVLTPEFIGPMELHDAISQAGRLIGIGDFRPTFGRFAITAFDVSEA